ncbi:HalOD1 output domain-containing protein [Halomicroarcula sp. GCM10025324]|jgi:hypothetical protein|uniref:HalOD1 output domain-containing protein n=1 Tax=Haloarcula TaxID=2237 RepID=UPI0023E8C7D5|nr:HalOD1 output domain-containing protein [Halomicroarcula sp. ZS-22-S1]
MTDEPASQRFELAGRGVTEAVVAAVASTLDSDPLDLPPLQGAVDVESVAQLWGRPVGRAGLLALTFRYADCRVRIEHEGSITVTAPA